MLRSVLLRHFPTLFRIQTMASTPSTPSATLPECESEWRFHDTSYPSEWVETYRPGRLHPVNLGDTFKDGQYRVIRKLGYGSFSTVWLARDTRSATVDGIKGPRTPFANVTYRNSRYVALKVVDAKASLKAKTELSILNWINERRSRDPLTQYILTNLDTFQHMGPNGTHLCLVSEPMGPTIASLAEELTPLEEWTVNIRYPKPMAWRILKHTLLGLRFLHKNGIVHADLQPGNLLSTVSNIDQLSEEDLRQDLSGHGRNPAPERVRRLDELEDKWAPRYLFLGQSLVKYTRLGQEMQVKISDFGAGNDSLFVFLKYRETDFRIAFWAQEPPESTVTPTALRAPELILGGTIDSSIDIWSFGCLIFEMLTGVPLFSVMVLFEDDRETTDDEHLLQMNDLLEPLPDIWLQERWPRAKNYFGSGRERLGPTHVDQNKPYIDDPLEVRFEEHKPNDVDDEEAHLITSLIRSILQYEPSQRPTADELLRHPWFQE